MIEVLSGKPKAPRVPRPEERPLSAEETAGFATGDPFKEHGLPSLRHENAVGKKYCAMCCFKQTGKWACGNIGRFKCPYPESAGACPGFSPKPLRKKGRQGGKKKGRPVPEGIKFVYYGRPTHRGPVLGRSSHDHHGVVTMAWIIPEPGVLHIAFSFCSPKDLWCKATGREMALARLIHPIIVPYLYSPKRIISDVARAVMVHDFRRLAALTPGAIICGLVPSWTKGLAKHLMGGTARERRSGGAPISILSTPRRKDGPFSSFCIDEAAEVSPEAWARLGKIARRRFLGAPPIDYSLGILARMMADIAALGND